MTSRQTSRSFNWWNCRWRRTKCTLICLYFLQLHEHT